MGGQTVGNVIKGERWHEPNAIKRKLAEVCFISGLK